MAVAVSCGTDISIGSVMSLSACFTCMLLAVLVVTLGGNSLGGGKFNLIGSIIGAYTIQAINATLLAMDAFTDQAPVIKAIIVIVIVVIQSRYPSNGARG